MTSIAPESTSSSATAEPSLAEAFGDLANGLVAAEDSGAATTSPSSSEATPPPSSGAAAAQSASSSAPKPETSATSAPTTSAATPATNANAQPAATTAPAAETPLADDPLAGSRPLTYSVNGETRTMDGVREYEGGGAVILAEALPKIKDRLQQADRLVVQNRALYEQSQAFNRLGGTNALAQLRAEKAVLDASGSILLRALTDPNVLVALATDPGAREQLLREVKLSAREAHNVAREQFQQDASRFQRERASAGQSQTAIGNAVVQLARGFRGLTTEDVQAVHAHALRVQSSIVRPANPDEARAAGVRVGEAIIDLPTLHHFLADRHGLRQQALATVKRDAAAARDNAAILAAARPTAAPAATAPRPGAAAGNDGKSKNGKQKTLDQMSSSELTRAMKTGRIFDMIGADE